MPPRRPHGIRSVPGKTSKLLLVLALASAAAVALDAPARAGLGKGDPAPDLSYVDLEGATHTWSDLQEGRPLVVVFWATWCKVCKKDWPDLIELHDELEAEGVPLAWAAVSVGEKSRVVAREVEARGLVGTQLLDPEEESFESLGLKYVPHVYVIDADGRVAYSGAPKIKKLRKVIGKVLDQLQERRAATEESR